MIGPDASPPTPPTTRPAALTRRCAGLVGRARELVELDALVDDLVAGRGRALALQGGPGVGKTTLLDALAEQDRVQLTVLRARGVHAEAELPFAALADLLGPLVPELDALAAPHSAALASALARGPSEPVDRLGVCVATLAMLRAAARRGPVLVVVDDLHRLDPRSHECVLYAARRAGGSVAVAVALGAARASVLDHESLPELWLGPLGREASRLVLQQRAPDLAGPVVTALADAAAGNPLALVELPGTLSRDQRLGIAPLDVPLRPGRRIRAAFGAGIDELDGGARRALLVAAAYAGDDLLTLAAACTAARTEVGKLVDAEGRGLIRITAGRAVFLHPLTRGVVCELARPAELRSAHRALAEALEGEPRTWHLAAAAVGPDPQVALELERVAATAASRRSFTSSAAALERAAQLSADSDAAAERLLAAGKAAAAAGLPDRALGLLARVSRADGVGRLQAQADRLRGLIMLSNGSTGPARTLLAQEAELAAGHDRVLAAMMLADAAAAATATNDYHEAEALAERAAIVLGDDGGLSARAQVHAILGWALLLRGRTSRARMILDEAERLAVGLDPLAPGGQWQRLLLQTALSLGGFERAQAESLALCDRARREGERVALSGALAVAADAAYRRGDWDTTDSATIEAIEVAEDTRQHILHGYALATRGRLLAARGRERESRAAIVASRTVAESHGIRSGLQFVHGALGFLELGLDRVEEVIVELETVERLVAGSGLEEPTMVPWAQDLIEVYVRVGRMDDAGRALATLEQQATATGTAPAASALARCRGLIAEDFEAEFAVALAFDDRRPMPFERARTLLGLGRRLHRARRRAEARDRLREAVAAFDRLGAVAWSRQAQHELRAAGARHRSAPAVGLTPQELRVAAAVTRGASNREIAAELFLSPKTIESHLRQIYRKLGVRSRPQLVAMLARRVLPEPASSPER